MEEKQQKAACQCDCLRTFAPFILGLAVALTIGWWVFPELLMSNKEQPVAFTHATHVEQAECADCHYLREDGSFTGIPNLENCLQCHESAIGSTRAEADFVRNYVESGREIPWLVHQKQPDNVFFSHAAHSMDSCRKCHAEFEKDEQLCMACHVSLETLDKPGSYKENRISTYSSTTMKMWQCESCHAIPAHLESTNANNACYTCHK